MIVYTCKADGETETFTKARSLWDALSLDFKKHMTIAFAGGGGKTSAMFALADELADSGKEVIVTTTTHIYCPLDRNVIPADRAGMVERYLASRRKRVASKAGFVVVTGQQAPDGKLKGLPPEETRKLAEITDVLLVEADGAKQLPIKFPGQEEPVFPDNTDVVIGCMGLDCIGRSYGEMCFRRELSAQVFGQERTAEEEITSEDGARILLSFQGTRKGTEKKQYRILLNKADDKSRRKLAEGVLKFLDPEWRSKCVITSFLEENPQA